MSTKFLCPYGCGLEFETSHFKCKGVPLARDKIIDFTSGRRGGLSPDLVLPSFTPKFECLKCENWFANLKNHVKCRGTKQGEAAAKKIILPTDKAEIDYTKVVYWIKQFTLRIAETEYEMGDYVELTNGFLSMYNPLIVHTNPKWLPELTAELVKRGQPPAIGVKTYVVPGRFTCCDLWNYELSSVDDFEKVNTMVYDITGTNLPEKWTIACVAYDYWEQLYRRVEHCDIQKLQGNDLDFSKKSYFSARMWGEPQNWVSSLAHTIEESAADTVEERKTLYQELLQDQKADIQVQVDGSSMYAGAMHGIKGIESYYPIGKHTRSMNGAAEFASKKCGIYEVKYTRPEGLKVGVLPIRVGKNGEGLEWPTTPETLLGVYTSVDLILAAEYGYTYEFTGDCITWAKVGNPFTSYVDILFGRRVAELDKVKNKTLKVMMTHLYGKMSQKDFGKAESKEEQKVSSEEAIKLMDQGIVCKFDYEEEVYYRVGRLKEATVKRPYNTKPNHLGCFILSWSRCLMMRNYKTVEFEFNHTHTDSLRVRAGMYHKLVAADLTGDKKLGLLNVEHGLIYRCNEANCNTYTLDVLTSEGELKVVDKGERGVSKKRKERLQKVAAGEV